MLVFNTNAFAWSWSDLWARPDQQGEKLLRHGKPNVASTKFTSPTWQGVAHYRAGVYKEAGRKFADDNSARGHYNRGNALAHLGRYEDAIAAYEESLRSEPSNEDARYNKKLVEKLLKQQSQQEQQKNKNKNNQSQKNKTGQNQKNPQQGSSNKQQQNNEKEGHQQANRHKSQQELEQQQANEQMLRRIPDDPGGLLRQKFLREHRKQQRLNRS